MLLVSGVGAAAGTALVAHRCWPHGPWVQWTVVAWDPAATLTNLLSALVSHVSTLAGLVCLAWLVLAAHGATGARVRGLAFV